ncbi:MAG: addiction module protein [Gemmatimonadota bacterium]
MGWLILLVIWMPGSDLEPNGSLPWHAKPCLFVLFLHGTIGETSLYYLPGSFFLEDLMYSSIHALEAAALLLPPGERAKLAERLIASLDRDPEVQAAWDEEIRKRVADFDAGRLESVPAEEVLAEARSRVGA